MTINTHPLVDRNRDVISRKIFHDQEIYEQEMERIFRKSKQLLTPARPRALSFDGPRARSRVASAGLARRHSRRR